MDFKYLMIALTILGGITLIGISFRDYKEAELTKIGMEHNYTQVVDPRSQHNTLWVKKP